WSTVLGYIDTRNYVEPMFVVVIMTLSATRPVIQFAETCLKGLAMVLGGSAAAWWLVLLTVGPILGSFLTEPAAMTICALILGRQFYKYQPSSRFKYATLGLLFVNISVGGTLTHFAAPPVLMVAGAWHWDTPFMLMNFGWKAVTGILISVLSYFFIFRKEFWILEERRQSSSSREEKRNAARPIPFWVTGVHLTLLAWTVINSHHPAIFIGSFIFFLGFYQATAPHQSYMTIRSPLLVGSFLAGLVIHGGLQAWWLAPILGEISEELLMKLAIVLTAFNDNAAVTYLTTLIPNIPADLKYAVVSGAVIGGGLTVIANAPNPAGQSLLKKYFDDGVSPLGLFLAAIGPTLIQYFCFLLLT
ncbi:MAG: putative Na+/H+ antiporter, partial [Chlamydiia bacterium]|nr:putative Na+/H+ antiporter [Chlamydiia bacterium]